MISSTSNARIKAIANLKKSARARNEKKCFLVEGPRMFFEVPKNRFLEIYMTQDFERKNQNKLQGYSYELISDNVCKHLSDTKTPQGVIAVVKKDDLTLPDLLKKDAKPCLFLLENLQDPGNLGTIIRTAEGAGVTGIIMNRQTVDPYNPKVIRSTMGAIFRVPFVIADGLEDVLEQLKKADICTYAAHLDGEIFYEYDYKKGCAFFIGNEGNGLTQELSEKADYKIKIPMKGQVESLNAAVASTVLMYEVMRQRDWSGKNF